MYALVDLASRCPANRDLREYEFVVTARFIDAVREAGKKLGERRQDSDQRLRLETSIVLQWSISPEALITLYQLVFVVSIKRIRKFRTMSISKVASREKSLHLPNINLYIDSAHTLMQNIGIQRHERFWYLGC